MEENRREAARSGPEKKGGVGRIISNIIGIILCVVFIPIVVVNLTLIIKSYIEPDHIPKVFGRAPVIVLSGSMFPEFDAGDLIFIEDTDPATLEVGDVICYMGQDGESAITHRIIEVQQEGGQTMFVVKGDANNAADGTPVTFDQIEGEYTGTYLPGVGEFAMFLQTTTGMILFVVVPLVLVVLWDVFRRAIASRKKADNTEALEAELERLRAQVAANDRTTGQRPDGEL